MNPILSPIQVRPGKRHFVDTSGSPLFFLGDTQWELFRLFDAPGALHILQERQAQGFNAILVMLLGVERGRVLPGEPADFTNLEGENPWIGDDPLRPNEAYFRHVDEIIGLGQQTGQTLIVGIYHQWHLNVITLRKLRPWARWVGHRYRQVPNLIWSMYPRAEGIFQPVCQELAAGLQEGDGGSHLVCVHPDPSIASSSFIHEEPWLAFNMIQTCVDYDQIHATVTADYARTPIKPVVMAEGAYEGLEFNKVQSAHDIRKQAYWTQLSGGHHVYGHNDAWVSPDRWHAWLSAPGASHLKVFKEIITSLDGWWDLVPDQQIFASGPSDGYSLNVAARSAAGDWLLVYLSEPSLFAVRLTALAPRYEVHAWWINPVDGGRSLVGIFYSHGVQPFVTPPDWPDALLLMQIVA